MRDFSLLDSAIDEMERVLLGNKPREAEEIYLQNAIDFIERFKKQLIEESKLNENQQIVLDWLKVDYCKKDSLFEALERIGEVYEDPKTEEAFYSLSRVEEAEVIQMFIEWFIEQEGTE
ncbi:TPA: hypothetical protein IUX81_002145 [Enterococcus faecalis]|nr:hypothetical protein [Enterococcus faecalis]